MAKKNINSRCPLSVECERKKCDFVNKELECVYYHTNAREDLVIEDQERIREEDMRRMEEEEFNRMLSEGYSGLGLDYEDPDDAEAPNEPTGKLVYIPIDLIYPHPDNPRKDLGDLSELATSIKANGVLQNLTVVPGHLLSKEEYVAMCKLEGVTKAVAENMYDHRNAWRSDGYMVIIGHRRHAAAKLAGLTELPCIIADMSDDVQVSTMLTENMQRADLTIYEQAKSFQQLSIDFGKSVEEISEMSGFSQSTVRRRTKLAELDEKKFKKACERGATLFDFAELDKVTDPEDKEKCLEAIGTANFKNTLSSILENQELKKRIDKWLGQVEEFATKIEQIDHVGEEHVDMRFIRSYNKWARVDDVETPEDAETVRYFYRVTPGGIDLYRENIVDSAEAEERLRKQAIRDRQDARHDELMAITRRHYNLRHEFIKNFGASKSSLSIIVRNAIDTFANIKNLNSYYNPFDYEPFAKLADLPLEEDTKLPVKEDFRRLRDEQPERMLLLISFGLLDSNSGRAYVDHKWNIEKQMYLNLYKDNQLLDSIYYFLEELGYECSDEERQMRRGTHPLFDKEEDFDGDPCEICKSSHPSCDKCCNTCDTPCNAGQTCRRE